MTASFRGVAVFARLTFDGDVIFPLVRQRRRVRRRRLVHTVLFSTVEHIINIKADVLNNYGEAVMGYPRSII